MKNFYAIVLILAGFLSAEAQNLHFKPSPSQYATSDLSKKFKEYSTFKFDVESLRNQIINSKTNYNEISIDLNDTKKVFALFEHTMFKEDIVVRIGDVKTTRQIPNNIRTFTGYNLENQKELIAFTMGDDFFQMMFEVNMEAYYFEQDRENPNIYILYKETDVNPIPGVICGADLVNHERHERLKDPIIEARNRGCREVDIALACDWSYVDAHRNPAGAILGMTAVLNLVQLDFFRNFNDDLIFYISEYFVPASQQSDPFRNSNDIMTHLNLFTANAYSMFTMPFDESTCWTAKFTSGIVGLAYLNAVCGPFPLNICSEFTTSSNTLRQLQSHEFGHNFSALHDAPGSPYIMAPVVNGSNVWSGASILGISTYIGVQGGCLALCPGSEIPIADFFGDPLYGCAPVTVQLTNASSFATFYKWKFPGGMPDTSNAENPTVTYTKTGFYDITLESFNTMCSNKITKKLYVEVNELPDPFFDFGYTDREAGFINLTVRGITYVWNFGDGSGSTEDNPYHTYAKDGDYFVTLTATNDCGSRSITRKVEIYTFPSVEFTSDTIAGCAPKKIKFIDQSSDNVTRWQWTFPGGKPAASFEKNPTVTYAKAGRYDVELRVFTAKFNANLIKKIYIKIDSAPVAKFNYLANGGHLDFTNQSIYPKEHYWFFGDGGTSRDTNPSHDYVDGTYEVIYVTTNDCGVDTFKQSIVVGAYPTAGFQGQQLGCIPYTVTFKNQSSLNSNQFRWYFPGGTPSTSTDFEPMITYNTVGTYDVSLVALSPAGLDSIGKAGYITVGEKPSSNFLTAVAGFKTFFTNLGSTNATYLWEFGDNKTSTETSPLHDYGVEGEFLVRLTVTNECGSSVFEKRIAVYLVPKVNFSADTIRGCVPFLANFIDKSSIDVIDWSWQFENGNPAISNQKNPTVLYNTAGLYTVKLTVKNTNGSNSATKIKFIEVISPVLCPKINKKKRKGGPGDDLGSFGDSRSNSEINEIEIYPNPASEKIYLDYDPKDGKSCQIRILSLEGQEILQKEIVPGVNEINTENLESGTYLIKCTNENSTMIRKIIINK